MNLWQTGHEKRETHKQYARTKNNMYNDGKY